MKNLPIKIEPCPIQEAVFEFRFKSKLPDDALFGIFYNEYKDEFDDVQSLPILQVPKAVRDKDSNLLNQPHYKISKGDISLLIGPRVIAVVNVNSYLGWGQFAKLIIRVYEKSNNLIGITDANRMSLRYINIFENEDIFKKANISLTFGQDSFSNDNLNLSSKIVRDNISSTLRVISGAEIELNEKNFKGSVIDIDSSINCNLEGSFDELLNLIHDEEKRIFYMLIGEKMLSELKVEYKETC